MKILFHSLACIILSLAVNAFSTNIAKQNVHSKASSELMATASRRDVLTNAAMAAAAAAVLVTPINVNAAATTEASYQGVYSDPKHPKGYRALIAKGSSSATMNLSDGEGENPPTFNIPLKVKVDKKAGKTLLSFDFSIKGGPKDVIGELASDGSTITFPDGNKWSKRKGVEGVYSDPNHPKGYRVIRKDKGSKLLVELKNDPKKDSVLISAKSGASKKEGVSVDFDFPGSSAGEVNKIRGSVDNGKISFPDGNKWTKL